MSVTAMTATPSSLGWLAAGLCASLAGPLLVRVSRGGRLLHAVDGFVVVTILGLVALEVMPAAWASVGWPAVPLALLGLLGPARLEHALHNAASRVHGAALVLAGAGLLLHAATDGAALSSGGDAAGLATSVVVHRLPASLTLWWLVRPRYGLGAAVATLCAEAVGTAIGFLAAGPVEAMASAPWIGGFHALVGGSLLHVVLHRGSPLPPHASSSRWSSLGAFAGLALVGLLFSDGGHEHGAAQLGAGHGESGTAAVMAALSALILESAPALLLGYLLAGLVGALLPSPAVRWLAGGGPLREAMRGVAFGLPLPLCSCGVVPVYRSLVARGAPAAAALGFFVATPEIGIDALLLSLPLLGLELTVARVVAAAAVAVLVGWAIGRALPSSPEAAAAAPEPLPPPRERLIGALRLGFGELVDATAPWIAAGLVVAAAATPWLASSDLASVPAWLQVPAAALIGLPLYICASGATPMVAVLVAHGVSPGAALALLLTGPATNVTTFGLLRDLHGRGVALRFGLLVTALATAAGWGLDALGVASPALPGRAHLEGASVARVAAATALLLLYAASLARLGPRRFLAVVWAQAQGGEEQGDDVSHGHGHGSDHRSGLGHASGHPHGHAHADGPDRSLGHAEGHSHPHGHPHRHGVGHGSHDHHG